jgi:hypothetical protein
MGLIDTYQIATVGQNLIDTYTLASNGILIRISIEDIPIDDVVIDDGGGIIPGQEWPEEEKKKVKKRITVIATVNGIEYKETLVIEDRPNLNIKDIDVDVTNTDTKPIIKIKVNGYI